MRKLILFTILLFAANCYSETNVNKEQINVQEAKNQSSKMIGYGLIGGGLVLSVIGLSNANGEKKYNPDTGVEETEINGGGAVLIGAGFMSFLAGIIIVTAVEKN